MAEPALRKPTFAELYEQITRLPEGMTGEILEPGVLRTMARPGKAHRRAAQQCFRSLNGADEAAGGSGWWIEQEAEIALPGGRLAVPDISGWWVSRVCELPEENPISVVPDWCCEVFSPSSASDDRTVKLPLYASSGVSWIWLIDPQLRSLEVFESVDGKAAFTMSAKDSDTAVLPPFDLDITVARWWLLSGG